MRTLLNRLLPRRRQSKIPNRKSKIPSRRRPLFETLESRSLLAVAPLALPDAGSVGTIDFVNAPLVVSGANGLLTNDSDPDLGDEITFRFQAESPPRTPILPRAKSSPAPIPSELQQRHNRILSPLFLTLTCSTRIQASPLRFSFQTRDIASPAIAYLSVLATI